MITRIAEHSVDISLLPSEFGSVLDIGCRGFLFYNELKRLGHHVYGVDIDGLLPGDEPYYPIAISGTQGKCSMERCKDPQANRIIAGNDTPMHTLKSFSELVGVDFWDLIKIDIEGSEYEVIMSLTEPPAKQLSIEFHLHTKIYGEAQIKEMEDKLVSLGYYPAKHDKTSEHGCGLNYWDSLFILK